MTWIASEELASSTPAQATSLVTRRPHDLRHAAVSTWFNAGAFDQAAAWAGHSVQIPLRIYAKIIDGQDEAARRLIEDAMATPE